MNIFLTASRIIVGILFIFSGLVKANDPLGLSYKMQEFFEVWKMHSFNDFTLAFSVIMIAFEIIAGVAVLLGWKMRFFSWLLLLLIVFFTFLTGYALFSGKIKECGCFGDCIPLQANQSFIKDLVLLVLIIPIFLYSRKIKPVLNNQANIIILFFTAIASFAFQWYVLLHLPVVDCLPYKKGNNILEKMQIPAGARPDSTVISFVYMKEGKEVEFTADEFPEDFDDDTYSFVRRYDKIVRKGNAAPPIKDFSLFTPAGSDTTQALLSEDRYQVYLFMKDEFKTGDWSSVLDRVVKAASARSIPSFVVSNINIPEGQIQPANLIPLRCDAVAIKTAARANPTLYLIRGGNIIDKWSYADLQQAEKAIMKLP